MDLRITVKEDIPGKNRVKINNYVDTSGVVSEKGRKRVRKKKAAVLTETSQDSSDNNSSSDECTKQTVSSRSVSARTPATSNGLSPLVYHTGNKYWQELEDQIKTISDDTYNLNRTSPRLKYSDTYLQVEREGKERGTKTDNMKKKITSIARGRVLNRRLMEGAREFAKQEAQHPKSRGWIIVKNNLKKIAGSSGRAKTFQLLLKHVHALSNLERSRRDMYIRYGIVSADGRSEPVNSMAPKINYRFLPHWRDKQNLGSHLTSANKSNERKRTYSAPPQRTTPLSADRTREEQAPLKTRPTRPRQPWL